MPHDSRADVVRERQLLGRVNRYALVIAVVDAVGVHELRVDINKVKVAIQMEMDRIAAALGLAELLELHPLDLDLGEPGANFYFTTPMLASGASGVGGQYDIAADEPHFGALVDAVVLVGAVAESGRQRSARKYPYR